MSAKFKFFILAFLLMTIIVVAGCVQKGASDYLSKIKVISEEATGIAKSAASTTNMHEKGTTNAATAYADYSVYASRLSELESRLSVISPEKKYKIHYQHFVAYISYLKEASILSRDAMQLSQNNDLDSATKKLAEANVNLKLALAERDLANDELIRIEAKSPT